MSKSVVGYFIKKFFLNPTASRPEGGRGKAWMAWPLREDLFLQLPLLRRVKPHNQELLEMKLYGFWVMAQQSWFLPILQITSKNACLWAIAALDFRIHKNKNDNVNSNFNYFQLLYFFPSDELHLFGLIVLLPRIFKPRYI